MATGLGEDGSSGFLASDQVDYDAYFRDHPDALEQDRQTTRDEIKSQVFLDDLAAGQNQFGGALLGILGLAVGAIYGLVDGIAFDSAIDEAIDEARGRREEIDTDIESVMNFRANIANKLAQFTTPMEQALRERARLHGLQTRAQGLTGAQAVAAQMAAEQGYRNTIGAQLPAAITNASREARADALAKLSAIEAKFGIVLQTERQQLLESQQAAELKAGGASGIVKGIGALAGGLGTFIDEIATQAAQSADAPPAATPAAPDDLSGPAPGTDPAPSADFDIGDVTL